MKVTYFVIGVMCLFMLVMPVIASGKSPMEARKELGQINVQYSPEMFVTSAANGDVLAVTLFLDAGMDVNEKESTTGMTALIAAAAKGRLNVVRTLLERKADVTIEDNEGETALTRSVEGDYVETARALLEAGAAQGTEYEYKSPELLSVVIAPYRNLLGTTLYLTHFVRNVARIGVFKALTLRNVATSLAKKGSFAEADEMFSQAIDVANSIMGSPDMKIEALCDISVALKEIGNIKRANEVLNHAIEIVNSSENSFWKARELDKIAVSLGKIGNTIRADEMFDQVIAIANSMSGSGWEGWEVSLVFDEVALAVVKTGNIERALEVANFMPDADDKAEALCDIAIELIEVGNTRQATEVVNQAIEITNFIKKDTRKVHPLFSIAVVLTKIGKTEQAGEMLNQAIGFANSLSWGKTRELCAIATELFKIGKTAQAEGVLSQAMKVANSIMEPDQKALALCDIATALTEIGKNQQADDVVNQVVNIAITIPDVASSSHSNNDGSVSISVDLRGDSLREIAVALAKSGYITQSTEVANSMADDSPRSAAFHNIIDTLLTEAQKAKQPDKLINQAIRIANSTPDEFTKVLGLRHIATELAKIGHVKKGLEVAKTMQVTERWVRESRTEALVAIASAGLDLEESQQAELAKEIMIVFQNDQ